MSVDAQNIKIITQNGHVTLRGAVNSPEEKQHVDDLATGVAKPGNVTDQLIITPSTKTTMNN
jgi:osmotically-inducible protein OsmY